MITDTKAQAIIAEQDSSPTSLSMCFEHVVSANPRFHVDLARAVALNGARTENAPIPKGALSPEMLDKEELLLACREFLIADAAEFRNK